MQGGCGGEESGVGVCVRGALFSVACGCPIPWGFPFQPPRVGPPPSPLHIFLYMFFCVVLCCWILPKTPCKEAPCREATSRECTFSHSFRTLTQSASKHLSQRAKNTFSKIPEEKLDPTLLFNYQDMNSSNDDIFLSVRYFPKT